METIVSWILWAMIFAQLGVYAWFSVKGGELSHKKFLIFTVGMLLGQIGAGVETYQHAAWRALIVQGYFFVLTAFGGIQRFRKMRREQALSSATSP
jgi:hypothetical protein